MSRYLNPYTDFGFEKLFGEDANKDLLIDFLNELLPQQHQIADLTFNNADRLNDIPASRRAVFDIYCTAKSGARFVVEMQKAKVNFFKERSLFYSTFPIRDQAVKGDWDFSLNPVYLIAILDFEYDEAEERRKFLRSVHLKDQDGDIFYDKLQFKFLQMPLFTKEAHELVSHFDKWCYFLKNLIKFEEIPAILREPIFEKAFRTSELAALTHSQYDEYQLSRLGYLEINAAIQTALDKGRAEGKAEAAAEGKAEERTSIYVKIIPRLFHEGKSVSEIALLLDLSSDEVQSVLDGLK